MGGKEGGRRVPPENNSGAINENPPFFRSLSLSLSLSLPPPLSLSLSPSPPPICAAFLSLLLSKSQLIAGLLAPPAAAMSAL